MATPKPDNNSEAMPNTLATAVDTISCRRMGGYRVYQRSGGPDYWEIIERFTRGELACQPIPNMKPHLRRLFKIIVHGTPMILKWQMGREERPEHLLWQIATGPFHSRLMRKVVAAVKQGCYTVQDMYLVAEKMLGPLCEETFTLLEYIEGNTLVEACSADASNAGPDSVAMEYVTKNHTVALLLDAQTINALRTAMMDMHRHRLWLNDLHPSNFIVTNRGIRIIDLQCRSSNLLAPAKDIVRLRTRYGIWLPLHGTTTRLACQYAHLLDYLRDKRRRRRAASQVLGL